MCFQESVNLRLILFKERCYKCNRAGHFARDCVEEQERCYNCNQLGHIAKDCNLDPDSGNKKNLKFLSIKHSTIY